jgi:hypothetical protein
LTSRLAFLTRSLLVATPTGSTAYSIGGGGSIVHPEIDAILLTPLNSMSLSSRPAILPGSCVIKLKTLQVRARVVSVGRQCVRESVCQVCMHCDFPVRQLCEPMNGYLFFLLFLFHFRLSDCPQHLKFSHSGLASHSSLFPHIFPRRRPSFSRVGTVAPSSSASA